MLNHWTLILSLRWNFWGCSRENSFMSMRDTKRCPGMKALHPEPSSWKSNQPMKMKGQLRIKSCSFQYHANPQVQRSTDIMCFSLAVVTHSVGSKITFVGCDWWISILLVYFCFQRSVGSFHHTIIDGSENAFFNLDQNLRGCMSSKGAV